MRNIHLVKKMKIESYEPFHIGSKFLYYVDKGHLLGKIYEYYETNLDEGFELNSNILRGEQSFLPIFNILNNPKKKLTLQMNTSANALNVIGNEPKEVIGFFKKLMKNLPNLGFELDSTFVFYEIITNIIILLDDGEIKPKEIFKKLSSNLFSGIQNLPNLSVNHIRFSDSLIARESDERFNLEILPNRTSPNKRIILKILKRVNNYEELIQFYEGFKSLIKKIYQELVK
ncbi:MAG: hypothetical protein BAJALOKI2v1_20031 [Promethearchaeota archaeon]|nr:MAG: hypothetical protein BAJALOKI2v1_20031 [Candidatus Lokiarchaeota archaeon]